LLKTFEKLGIPLTEQKQLAGVAVDAVFDSVSVATTYKEKLRKHGVIFCSFTEAIRDHAEIVQKYLGSVVPTNDNFFAALNSAVFSDGSFCFIPKGVRCPMELSTYFRINNSESGQFERTLIVAEEGSHVSYLEGCTATLRAKCVIIATGAEYNRIEAEGRENFDGLGVYYAATALEGQLCRGATVIVAGGGNSAGQAAMFLSENAAKVLLVIRGGDLSKSMSSYLSRRVEGKENIEILYFTEIRKMSGSKCLEVVELENVLTKEQLSQLHEVRQNAPVASKVATSRTMPGNTK